MVLGKHKSHNLEARVGAKASQTPGQAAGVEERLEPAWKLSLETRSREKQRCKSMSPGGGLGECPQATVAQSPVPEC